MKLKTLTLTTAAVALLGGAAFAQAQPAAPTPGSVTGDWNGPHAPSDDKQYKEKVTVPVAAAPAAEVPAPAAEPIVSATATTEAPDATAATAAGTNVAATTASFTNLTVTNGPVPDTRENRARYGQPLSRAGKMTSARGN